MSIITCYGEILWDIFPTHKKIGGAPLNVALRLNGLGNTSAVISAIGNDDLGNSLLEYIQNKKLPVDFIQVQKDYSTGIVKVSIDQGGNASYDIEFPKAWDAIKLSKELLEQVEKSDAFVFGSLIARHETSKNTLIALLKKTKYNVFDVNLRPPHYSYDLLDLLMQRADFIKFNDEELFEICNHFKSKKSAIEDNILFISELTNTKHICVTKGSRGAVLYLNNHFYYNNGYRVKVEDTVGAGDSFLASLISELLKKTAPQKALNLACAFGALVASNKGANPEITSTDIQKLTNS